MSYGILQSRQLKCIYMNVEYYLHVLNVMEKEREGGRKEDRDIEGILMLKENLYICLQIIVCY